MTQKIEIRNYEVQVSLGCYPEERLRPQTVRFSVRLLFDGVLKCAATDELKDAVDYVKVTDIIQATAASRHYSLVESLNLSVAEAVLSYLKLSHVRGELQLETQKVVVPVKGLKDGVSVSCAIKF